MVTGPELPHTIRARLDVNEFPPIARLAASVSIRRVLMGRTQIVCGGKRVSEDERKRKAGGRGAAAGATPTRRFTRLENARGRPRSPVLRPGPSGHPLPGTHTLGPLSAAACLQLDGAI